MNRDTVREQSGTWHLHLSTLPGQYKDSRTMKLSVVKSPVWGGVPLPGVGPGGNNINGHVS